VVDSGSEPPVAIPADWPQPGRLRIIVEPTPGLTPARLRGIREAQSEFVVFVDDGNLLDAVNSALGRCVSSARMAVSEVDSPDPPGARF